MAGSESLFREGTSDYDLILNEQAVEIEAQLESAIDVMVSAVAVCRNVQREYLGGERCMSSVLSEIAESINIVSKSLRGLMVQGAQYQTVASFENIWQRATDPGCNCEKARSGECVLGEWSKDLETLAVA